jgi:hypothetical protein
MIPWLLEPSHEQFSDHLRRVPRRADYQEMSGRVRNSRLAHVDEEID